MQRKHKDDQIRKPLTLWLQDEPLPRKFHSSLDAQKELGKDFSLVTSGSIEIVERISVEGSTISSKEAAGLRNWAIKELDICAATNTKLSFADVKYKPQEDVLDKTTGELITQPAKLIFRRSIPRTKE